MSLKILFIDLLSNSNNVINNLIYIDTEILIINMFNVNFSEFNKMNLPINLKYIVILDNVQKTDLNKFKVPFGCKVLLNNQNEELIFIRSHHKELWSWYHYELNNEVKQYLNNNKERKIINEYFDSQMYDIIGRKPHEMNVLHIYIDENDYNIVFYGKDYF